MGLWASALGLGQACPPLSTLPASQGSGKSSLGVQSKQPHKILQTGPDEAPVTGEMGWVRSWGIEEWTQRGGGAQRGGWGSVDVAEGFSHYTFLHYPRLLKMVVGVEGG